MREAMSEAMREAGRLLLLDTDGRVLLIEGTDTSAPSGGTWWFTPGGGVEPGETHRDAAVRETFEELGIQVVDVGPPCLEQTIDFTFDSARFHQHELFFSARTPSSVTVDGSLRTELERRSLLGTRWWSVDDLRTTDATIYPADLAEVLQALLGHA